jgi:hypothetical protein
MVDAQFVGIHIWNLGLTALIAAGLTWLCQTNLKQFALAFALVFSLFTVASSFFAISQSGAWSASFSAREEVHESMRLSAEHNVLVVSLDGLQGHVAAKLLRENTEIADIFRDFTIFENVLSQSPATEASIVGELFGIRDYKALGDSLDDVIAELERRGLVKEIPLLRLDDAYQRGYLFGKGMQIPQGVTMFLANLPISDRKRMVTTYRRDSEIIQVRHGTSDMLPKSMSSMRSLMGFPWATRARAIDIYTLALHISRLISTGTVRTEATIDNGSR